MPLMTSAAVKAEMAQRAAILQGREGWPTPEWGKGKDRFAVYSPLLNAGAGRKDFPISGTVNGRPYATCRVATSFSRSVGVNSRRTTTYYHTAAIFPNTGVGLPYFDIISTTGEWERLQNFDKLRMNTGDAQFHQFLSVSANAADQPAVYRFLTPEIARAFLVPQATMAPRISRAKKSIKASGSTFRLPPEGAEREERLRVVLHVLYLIFNEGYTASSGEELHRSDLAAEAIRLTRLVHAQLPDDSEVAGLLALMLLTHARRKARTTATGDLIPLDEQDRTQWDRELIEEGLELAKRSLGGAQLGPYSLQAAIAATHSVAATAQETDWAQVYALYLILERVAPNPMVTLNRAIALAEVENPKAGLELLATLDDDARMADHHRLPSVRAHLLEKAGDAEGAYANYRLAAKATASLAERRYLESRAKRARASGA